MDEGRRWPKRLPGGGPQMGLSFGNCAILVAGEGDNGSYLGYYFPSAAYSPPDLRNSLASLLSVGKTNYLKNNRIIENFITFITEITISRFVFYMMFHRY